MRFATHVLAFNQDQWLEKNILNSGPFVEKIYVAYSTAPWAYNRHARQQFTNTFDPSDLEKSPYYDKCVFIKGDWALEEHQRNACAQQAKNDGMDYMLTHDADEFYSYEDFKKILKFIEDNPDYDGYLVPWISFWKNLNQIMLNEKGERIIGYPQIAINLNTNTFFKQYRIPSSENTITMKDVLCYHMSFVASDKQCYEKINTWGHSHQFDTEKWFREVWLSDRKYNLHPLDGKIWSKCVPFEGELPEVLR